MLVVLSQCDTEHVGSDDQRGSHSDCLQLLLSEVDQDSSTPRLRNGGGTRCHVEDDQHTDTTTMSISIVSDIPPVRIAARQVHSAEQIDGGMADLVMHVDQDPIDLPMSSLDGSHSVHAVYKIEHCSIAK